MTLPIDTDDQEKRFLKITQLSHYLSISPATLRKWIRQGKVPFVKINGAIRFDRRKIDSWIGVRNAQSSIEELND